MGNIYIYIERDVYIYMCIRTQYSVFHECQPGHRWAHPPGVQKSGEMNPFVFALPIQVAFQIFWPPRPNTDMPIPCPTFELHRQHQGVTGTCPVHCIIISGHGVGMFMLATGDTWTLFADPGSLNPIFRPWGRSKQVRDMFQFIWGVFFASNCMWKFEVQSRINKIL